jgi:predicted AlkP superfamily pyrophosphatase or phosphodiesterase
MKIFKFYNVLKNPSFFLIAALIFSCNSQKQNTYPLLLISIDGLKPDYIEKYETPNIDLLINDGALADWMIPVFPSNTFPNHYSLVTGLYTENTGVVANNMYDYKMDAWFSLGNREAVMNADWYGGEPIWVTAEKQGVKAATMFWPGSEAPIKGIYPTHWVPYDGDLPHFARVDSIISWLQSDEIKPGFLSLYFSKVDSYGHRYGPDSDSVSAALEDIDKAIGYLIDELNRNGLLGKINILITSDHGMAATSEERAIFIDDIINMDDVAVYDWNPVAMIQPKEGKKEKVYNAFKEAENHFKVFKKEDIPELYRVKNHYRVPEIMVIADIGYTLTTRSHFERRGISKGTHGYDHREPEMRAFFLAYGPSFKKGERISSFQNIHVYELMCRLLNLEPAPNDGHPDSLKHLLSEP